MGIENVLVYGLVYRPHHPRRRNTDEAYFDAHTGKWLNVLKKINADRIKREQIESLEKARRDELWRRNSAERKGLADGLAKGRDEGRQQRNELIRMLLQSGVDAGEIARRLNLPVEEIEKLIASDSR